MLYDGTNLWVALHGDDALAKVSPANGLVVSKYTTSNGPFSIAFDGFKVWVPNSGSASISVTAAKVALS